MENPSKKIENLKEIKALIAQNDLLAAYNKLFEISDFADDYSLQNSYSILLKKLDSQTTQMPLLKVAVLSSSTVDHLLPVLRFWLAKEGFRVDFFTSEFNSITQSILDPTSELYTFKPEIIWLFQNHRDFKIEVQAGADQVAINLGVSQATEDVLSLWSNIQKNCPAIIIQNNADLPNERIFGNLEANVPWSKSSLLQKFNLELATLPKQGVQIFDLEYLASWFGKNQWLDARFWYHSKHSFNIEAIGLVAFHGARAIAASKGKAKKCLVIDLDNTIWGGVIGDDGLDGIKLGNADGEAFLDFQKYILQLKNRGVILAVCSKNEEAAAKLPFESHPDMQLKLNDISVFMANWNNKADNIRAIAETLNIGLDSIVFVDDNPVERNLVRKFLPMVSVPEIPEDPVDYLSTLDKHAYFETLSFSDEDKERNNYYRDNSARNALSQKFQNLDEYLLQLQMDSHYGVINSFQLPRAVQLINKSNQFNLTTIRYTEGDVSAFLKNPAYTCLYFKLKDRFGDNGLISVVILNQKNNDLFIDTWVMSCRVLSRGMEEFIFNEIQAQAKQKNCNTIVGTFIPTAKNKMVSGLYKKLNFEQASESEEAVIWKKAVHKNSEDLKVFINKISEDLNAN